MIFQCESNFKAMDNINIMDIHFIILQKYEDERKMIPVLKKRIDELTLVGASPSIIQEIQARFDAINSNKELHFYILQSSSLIEEYKKELNKPVEMSFMGSNKKNTNPSLDKLVEAYVALVRELHPISLPSSRQIKACQVCDGNKKEYVIDATNTTTCSCGIEKDNLQFTFSHKDADRVNVSIKYQYQRKLHFRDCINQFQGKQNSTVKQQVYDDLRVQFDMHGLTTVDNCDATCTDKCMDKYRLITKYHVSFFLKETGHSNHYEDLNMIYHTITGNKLDDISYLENALEDDFEKLSKIYDEDYVKTKKIKRKNFLNTQYILYQLLRRHNYPCSEMDFTFLKTIERKGFHDDICSDLFKKLGWSFKQCF